MKISELGPRIYNYHRKDGIYRCWKKVNRGRKEGKDRGTRVSTMRVDGRHATMHPTMGVSPDGGRRRWYGVCQYHVQRYHSEACMAGVGNDVTQYLGVSLV